MNLVDLYPTLTELAGLPAAPQAEGRSIVPLLKNPAADWPRPSLTTFKPGNHSLFGERWHYIRYADGSEELYDIEKDPNEWTNLANLPSSAEIKKEMSRFLPPTSATPVPGKKEYTFDPVDYTWTKKTPKKSRSKP